MSALNLEPYSLEKIEKDLLEMKFDDAFIDKDLSCAWQDMSNCDVKKDNTVKNNMKKDSNRNEDNSKKDHFPYDPHRPKYTNQLLRSTSCSAVGIPQFINSRQQKRYRRDLKQYLESQDAQNATTTNYKFYGNESAKARQFSCASPHLVRGGLNWYLRTLDKLGYRWICEWVQVPVQNKMDVSHFWIEIYHRPPVSAYLKILDAKALLRVNLAIGSTKDMIQKVKLSLHDNTRRHCSLGNLRAKYTEQLRSSVELKLSIRGSTLNTQEDIPNTLYAIEQLDDYLIDANREKSRLISELLELEKELCELEKRRDSFSHLWASAESTGS